MAQIPASRRRFLQFSLRTLLIVTTIVCAVFGLWIGRSLQQRRAIQALAKSSELADVYYRYQLDSEYEYRGDDDPPGPEWLRDLLGIDFLDRATSADISDPEDEQLALLRGLPYLEALKLSGCDELSVKGYECLRPLTGLKKLELYMSSMEGEELAFLESLPNLEVLNLVACGELTDVGLAHISTLENLRQLYLELNNRQTTTGVAGLRSLKKLKSLHLIFHEGVSDETLELLQELSDLETLDLTYSQSQGGHGLRYLTALRRLNHLTFDGWDGLTDDGFSQLPELPSVKTLKLFNCAKLTDDSLKNLAKFPNLESLFLSAPSGIGDGGMQYLARLTKLKELTIWEDKGDLTDSDLEQIAKSSSLQEMKLFGCSKITDQGLTNLAKLADLKNLTIQVDDISQLSDPARKLPELAPQLSVQLRPTNSRKLLRREAI